jgi:hypothetical protein
MAYTSVPLQSFDTLVDDALLRLVGAASAIPRTDSLAAFFHRASIIRSLSMKLGGLGLARHAGINSEKNVLLSKNIYCTFLPAASVGTYEWQPIYLGFGHYHERLNLHGELTGGHEDMLTIAAEEQKGEVPVHSPEGEEDPDRMTDREIRKRVDQFQVSTQALLHNKMITLG